MKQEAIALMDWVACQAGRHQWTEHGALLWRQCTKCGLSQGWRNLKGRGLPLQGTGVMGWMDLPEKL